eukprot:3856579-Rhodomonas_salina.1
MACAGGELPQTHAPGHRHLIQRSALRDRTELGSQYYLAKKDSWSQLGIQTPDVVAQRKHESTGQGSLAVCSAALHTCTLCLAHLHTVSGTPAHCV